MLNSHASSSIDYGQVPLLLTTGVFRTSTDYNHIPKEHQPSASAGIIGNAMPQHACIDMCTSNAEMLTVQGTAHFRKYPGAARPITGFSSPTGPESQPKTLTDLYCLAHPPVIMHPLSSPSTHQLSQHPHQTTSPTSCTGSYNQNPFPLINQFMYPVSIWKHSLRHTCIFPHTLTA